MENQELVVTSGSLVPVQYDRETVQKVISISDADCIWLKATEAGFLEGDTPIGMEISGIIFDIKPYWIMWIPGQPPDKVPFTSMDEQPSDYELRTDLKIRLMDRELIGLSLSPSSARNFSRYMRRVEATRLDVSSVITTIRPRSVMNKNKQKFVILDFEYHLPDAAVKQSMTAPENDDIPF
jgi:hypothetical protein